MTIEISTELFQAIAQYLLQKPYGEVATILKEMERVAAANRAEASQEKEEV